MASSGEVPNISIYCYRKAGGKEPQEGSTRVNRSPMRHNLRQDPGASDRPGALLMVIVLTWDGTEWG
jgi:hypothetical protein